LIDRLEAIAESNTPAGAGRGFAIHENSGTIVAQCIDVDIENGQTRVLRVVSVVDCGFVVNPTTATEQIEGAVIFGLSAAINGEIHVEKGVVMNDNFDSYPLMRMNACPELQTYFEARDNADWGGLGEPGVPPVAPALCNAIFAATGIRVRSLPVANHDLGAQVTPRTS
jgi:isoquinoline 1-oxidoreductase beta subunit